VTQADINKVKDWGFNAVRLPLHYEYFVNLGTPDVWNEQGFNILDIVLTWCEIAGVYVIIDLHAAPGGQSNNAISDYDNTKPSLWESEANKAKTVRLWRKIAERYKYNTAIAGYDLINEPAWNLPGGTALRQIYGRLTDTIRAINDNHILFIEGNWYSNDYTGLTPAWDENMVYVFHKYWSTNNNNDIKFATDIRSQQNRPIWCGEHGENSNENFTKTIELFRANNIGTSWWPMKKFESINDFADAKWPAGYQDLINYLGGSNPNYNPSVAYTTLMELANNLKLANCKEQTEVLHAIFVQPGNRNTTPFVDNKIPGTIYASHYDMGMNGYAYNDNAWEDLKVSTGVYTAWNNGWLYRNNGVDLEVCNDSLSNGYSIGWFEAGEWTKYTANVQNPGTYKVELRLANGGFTNTVLQIQNADGTQTIASVNVPSTGGWHQWQNIETTVSWPASANTVFRLVVTEGSVNVASMNFVYLNSELTGWTTAPTYEHTVTLKGNNGKYITYKNAGNLMNCTSGVAGKTEEFTLVDAGNGKNALRGSNLMYVTLGADGKLYCNSATIGNQQLFTLNNLCGVYSLRGPNNMYISSEDGAATGITCNRASPQGWEYFPWQLIYTTRTYPVGINDNPIPANIIKIYPNPAQYSLQVQCTAHGASLTIYNMSGQAVGHSSLLQEISEIDISYLPNGIYTATIRTNESVEYTKFIIQK